MQHRLVVFDLFLPTRQDAAKAIHPAVCSFYNPTMSLEVGVFNRLRLLLPRLDMGFITTRFQTGFQPFGFIAFVHAQTQPATRHYLSEVRRAYLQPALCRGYWPRRQPARAEVRSHRSSGCALHPAFPGQ